jgi:hypothetical protein
MARPKPVVVKVEVVAEPVTPPKPVVVAEPVAAPKPAALPPAVIEARLNGTTVPSSARANQRSAR